MSQTMKVRGVATKVFQDSNKLIVRYHNTDVVTVEGNTVTLNNGGYFTATTKTRMNQTANEFGYNFGVYQRNYSWFVETPNGVIPFNGKTVTFQL